MRKFIDLSQLFVLNSKLTISRITQYRFDFFVGILISTMFSSIGPILQYLIFTQTKGFPEWTLNQIILFQGVLLLVLGFRGLLFGNVKNQFINFVRKGDLDRLLLKPYSPMGILFATSFTLDNLGTIIAGGIITIWSIVTLGLEITIGKIILLLVCVFFGILLNMVFDIFHCSLIMITIADGGIQGIINAYLRFSEYPLQIYPKVLQTLFVMGVPLAIFIYFPTQVLLGRIDLSLLYGCLSTLVLFFLSLQLWKQVLKKYTSAGG